MRAEHGARVVQLGRDGPLSAARDGRVAAARVLQVRPVAKGLMISIPAASPCMALRSARQGAAGRAITVRASFCTSCAWLVACREVYGQQEYDFHVYKELMWGEEAGAPNIT